MNRERPVQGLSGQGATYCAVTENSAKTQFRITRWNSTLKVRCLLSSHDNISAQNASNSLENPLFESVFCQLINCGQIISVSGIYMNQNALELVQLFLSHRANLSLYATKYAKAV